MKKSELYRVTDHHIVLATEAGWHDAFALFLPHQGPKWIAFPAGWPTDLETAGDKYKQEWEVLQATVGLFSYIAGSWYPKHGRFITMFETMPLYPGEYWDLTPLPANRMQNWEGYVALDRPVQTKFGIGVMFHYPALSTADMVITDFRYRVVQHD